MDASYYFDVYAVFDNFYRVVQRAIFRLAPNYKQTWNDRQKAASRNFRSAISSKYPEARTYRPVYYRWKAGDGSARSGMRPTGY